MVARPGIVIAPFVNDAAARRAGRSVAARLPGIQRITFEDAGQHDLGEAASHAAASRTAARGALVAIALSTLVILAFLAAGAGHSSWVLALGAAVACTGAPFAGGLAGFTIGLHRWSADDALVLPWDRAVVPRPVFLAVRTLRVDAVSSMLQSPSAPPAGADAVWSVSADGHVAG